MTNQATAPGRIDWKTVRDAIDLAAVATDLLGPAPGRTGSAAAACGGVARSTRIGTRRSASTRTRTSWKCFGCGEHGDAVDLVMKLRSDDVPEAVAYLTGGPTPRGGRRRPARDSGESVGPAPEAPDKARSPGQSPAQPSGLPEADALALVEAAAAPAVDPRGGGRPGLPDRPAVPDRRDDPRRPPRVDARGDDPDPEGDRGFRALGVVIPWFAGDRLALVKIRQPDGRRPKYAEAFRDPARLVCYPGPETIRPGRPLVIVEGEFDALLLGRSWPPMPPW